KARRPRQRTGKNSYKIPYERIRDVLNKAEKAALKQVQAKWASFLNKLKTVNAPAHATIQDSKPAAASNDTIIVAFKYEIHCSLFLDHRTTVESILSAALGKQVRVIPIPNENWQELRTSYIQEQDKETKETANEPIVEEAKKLFGEDLVEIHED